MYFSIGYRRCCFFRMQSKNFRPAALLGVLRCAQLRVCRLIFRWLCALAGRRLSSEHAGWAEGSCVTSRRIHEAVLRVIVSPPAGGLYISVFLKMVPWFKKTRYFDNPLTNNYGRLPLSCDKTELRIHLYDISKYSYVYHRAALIVVLPFMYNYLNSCSKGSFMHHFSR